MKEAELAKQNPGEKIEVEFEFDDPDNYLWPYKETEEYKQMQAERQRAQAAEEAQGSKSEGVSEGDEEEVDHQRYILSELGTAEQLEEQAKKLEEELMQRTLYQAPTGDTESSQSQIKITDKL